MAQFIYQGHMGSGGGSLLSGVVDFHIDVENNHLVSVGWGGLVSFSMTAQGGLRILDSAAFSADAQLDFQGEITLFDAAEYPFLVIGGAQDRLSGARFGPDGSLGQIEYIGILGLLDAVPHFSIEGFTFMAQAETSGLCLLSPLENQTFQLDTSASYTCENYGREISHINGISLSHGTYLVSVGGDEQPGVTAWSVNTQTGSLTKNGHLGAADGLGLLPNVTGLEVISSSWGTFVVVASAASTGEMGALSILQLEENGQLNLVDHVLDTRNTRFSKAPDISVAQQDGRSYVLVGGADDGLAFFELLPNGRLHYWDSVADTTGISLENLNGVGLFSTENQMQVVASSQSATGFAQFSIDIGNTGTSHLAESSGQSLVGHDLDDVLIGAGGNDRLFGGAGDDLLFDGVGRDTLQGGSGADRFIIVSDQAPDQILDFDPSEDWFDLSGLSMLYDPSALNIESTSQGARIMWRDDTLEVFSDNGRSLAPDILRARILDGPDRPPVFLPNFVRGGTTADRLSGHAGDDEIIGLHGADTLFGWDGRDTIFGGGGYDSIHSHTGDDIVHGGNGRDKVRLGQGDDIFFDTRQNDLHGADTVMGDAGHDTILGGGGADVLFGHAGFDRVTGGRGDDHLFGGNGFDTLRGGTGDDLVVGGNGRDLAFLGSGNDVFHDNSQGGLIGADTIWSGGGKDTVQGGNGPDRLHGQAGSDLLIGRLDDDGLFGGDQDDRLAAGDGNDTVVGGRGRDLAWLGNGDDQFFDHIQSNAFGADRIWAGSGNDTIYAAGGNDTLSGGGGADTFVFRPLPGKKRITDFNASEDNLHINMHSAEFSDTIEGLIITWLDGSVLLEGLDQSQVFPDDIVFL